MLALIGCGRWGRNLARNFARLGVLAAIVEADDEAWSAVSGLGARRASLQEVLNDPALSSIAIATPAPTHAELAVLALQSGRDVFVEKPLAMSVEEARSIERALDASGRLLMVGHLLRYHPAFIRLEDELRTGDLGSVLYVDSARLSLGQLRGEEDVFRSLAPHDVSMVLAIMGESPVSIQADGAGWVTPGLPDVSGCQMRFSGGRYARIRVSWLSPVKEQRLLVVCERGSLFFDDLQPWDSKLVRRRHRVLRDPPSISGDANEPIPLQASEPLLEECRAFVEACRTRSTPKTNIGEAMAVQFVLDAVQEVTGSGDFSRP